jgi:TolC family type I secretion outer membrane protein
MFKSNRILSIVIIFISCMMIQSSASADNKKFNLFDSIDLDKVDVLDLKTAQKIAIEGNPSLDAARERVVQAKKQLIQARSSYFPSITASGSGNRSILSDNDQENNPGVDDTTDLYSASISASWTLFNGFQREYNHMSARYGKESSVESKNNVLRLMLYQVAASYFNAQLARENINIAEANKEFNERQLAETEARYRVGTGSLSDVLNFKVRINSAKAQLIVAEQSYEVALYGLASLMGIPDSKLPPHIKLSMLEDESGDELIIPDSSTAINYALEHRPDLQQSNHLFKQAEAGVGSARSGYYPSVSITGSIEDNYRPDRKFERDDFGKSLLLNISLNLFNGWQTTARVGEARSRLRESQRNIEDTQLTVISDVESAVTQLKAAQKQLKLQRENTTLVRQTRDLVEKEYTAGQGSLVRLNEAQRDLVTAESNLVLSLLSMRQAWEGLKSSTGEILEDSIE